MPVFEHKPLNATIMLKYERLSHHEHVLKRPDMYIGSVRPAAVDTYVVRSSDGVIAKQRVDIAEGLLRIFIEPLSNADDIARLQGLIHNHVKYTGSEFASNILRDWTEMVPRFVKVMPIDYRHALERLKQKESKESESVDMTEEVFR